jgi:chemotaxis protein methyltransferase CheR
VADAECVAFLQWALPRLGRRWAGYRKVRRQVCRRVGRRAAELGLDSLADYRAHLEANPKEWDRLDGLTNVTISRFHRDRGVFAFLRSDVLPTLAGDGGGRVRAWSAGCAGGEEAYTLVLVWELGLGMPGDALEVLATDVAPAMLERARRARYAGSSLRELPAAWRAAAFVPTGDEFELHPQFRRQVAVAAHDIRGEPPEGPFDLVLCRHVAFTYFDAAGQRDVLRSFARATRPGGALVIGTHETLPAAAGFMGWNERLGVFRRAAGRP